MHREELTSKEKAETLATEWSIQEFYYMPIVEKMKELGFSVMHDIGCGYGSHMEIISQNNVKYIGYDRWDNYKTTWFYETFEKEFPEAELHFGVNYPFPIISDENSVAVSICAIGGNYVGNSFTEQMEQVKKDFKHFFVTIFDAKTLTMHLKKFWNHCEPISGDVYHFWND